MSVKLILKWDGGPKFIKIENWGTKKLDFKIGRPKLQKMENRGSIVTIKIP
jgi:hypothetical protein